jgi:hypothetical protein
MLDRTGAAFGGGAELESLQYFCGERMTKKERTETTRFVRVVEEKYLDIKKVPTTPFYDLCSEYWQQHGRHMRTKGLYGGQGSYTGRRHRQASSDWDA